MGCNGTVGLSAGRRVAGGDSFWLSPVRPDGPLPRLKDADAGVRTQNSSSRYMRLQRPARREGRTQQGAAGRSRAQQGAG